MKWIYWLLCGGTLYVAALTLERNPHASIVLSVASIAWGISALFAGRRQ